MEIKVGQVIQDRYRIEAFIGEGGMASVFQARHLQLDSVLALKVLHVSTKDISKRLLAEGRAQGNLHHINVVSVTDVVDIDGTPGLVMELIKGPTLREFLDMQRLTLEQADILARGVIRGVQAAHEHNLIHRDLKPSNILLDIMGTGIIPKITDFGLAKCCEGDLDTAITRTGIAMGTPAYMSPEQIEDAKNVDGRADIFSLGVILYELVTGEMPFTGTSPLSVFNQILKGEYKPPCEVEPKVPRHLESCIIRCLQADREARFDSVSELLKTWSRETDTPDLTEGPWKDDLLERARKAGSEVRHTLIESDEQVEFLPTLTSAPGTLDSRPSQEAPVSSPEAAASKADRPNLIRVLLSAGPFLPWLISILVGLVITGLFFTGNWNSIWVDKSLNWTFSAHSSPELSTPAATEALSRSWEALLQTEFEESQRYAAQALELDPESVLPHLITAITLKLRGQHAEVTALLTETIDNNPDLDEDLQALLSAATLEDMNAPRLYSEAHPDDLLMSMLWPLSSNSLDYDGPDQNEHYLALIATYPGIPLIYYTYASWQTINHNMNDALNVIETAAAEFRLTPHLRMIQGTLFMILRDFEQAREIYEGILQEVPGLLGARIQLSIALLNLGEEEASQFQREILESETTPLHNRINFSREYSSALFVNGRLSESLSLLSTASELSTQSNKFYEAAWFDLFALTYLYYFERYDLFPEYLDRLRRNASAPELPDLVRKEVQSYLRVTEAHLAIHNGDLDEARRLLGMLEATFQEGRERGEAVISESLPLQIQISLEAQEGSLEKAIELYQYPDLELNNSCKMYADFAYLAHRAGQMETARETLGRFFERYRVDEECHIYPLISLISAIRYARMLIDEGDSPLAIETLELVRGLWRNPDRDLQIVQDLNGLAGELNIPVFWEDEASQMGLMQRFRAYGEQLGEEVDETVHNLQRIFLMDIDLIVHSCYEQEVAVNPSASGSLFLEVDLSPEGRVSRSALSNTCPDSWSCDELTPVESDDNHLGNTFRCVRQQFREIQVEPAPGESLYISQRYILEPGGGTTGNVAPTD